MQWNLIIYAKQNNLARGDGNSMPTYSPSTAWEFPWALRDMKSIHSHSCFCVGKVWETCSQCMCGLPPAAGFKVASHSFYSTISFCSGSQRQSSQGLWLPLVLQCKLLARVGTNVCGGSSRGTLVVSWTKTQTPREPTCFLVICSQVVMQGCKTSIRHVNTPRTLHQMLTSVCVFSAVSVPRVSTTAHLGCWMNYLLLDRWRKKNVPLLKYH